MTKDELIALAKEIAVVKGLDPVLIAAICEQESAWDTNAIRYEPAFYRKYIMPLKLVNQTEAHARAFSWGVMQTMGQVAREHGFEGKYLSELCVPLVGITVGCTVFAAKLKRAHGDQKQALLYWNGGGRPAYVDEVLARLSGYQT